ncbi:MAG: diacylglycerol kinase family protein [Sphingomonadaceae bacterium]
MHRPLSSSFRDAFRGVLHTLGSQRNARIHLTIGLAVVGLGFWLRATPLEWAVLVLTIGLVIATEMLNTAIEALADAVCPDHNHLIGAAKDVAAGAVLVTATAAIVVGLLLFGPRLVRVLAGAL